MTDGVNDGIQREGIVNWFYGAIFKAGWRRRIVFAVAVILFLLLFSILRESVDYRQNPSALTSREAVVFLETRDLSTVMGNVAQWPLWQEDKRIGDDDDGNLTQNILSDALGDKVHGLGSRLPLSWLRSARHAAFAILPDDGGEPSSWALYFNLATPMTAVRELAKDQGLTLKPLRGESENLYLLAGNDERKLAVGMVGPWFIVASDPAPVLFAADAVKKPNLTLAALKLLSEWKRDAAVRGILEPAPLVKLLDNPHFTRLAGWMQPDARVAVSAKVDAKGLAEVRFDHTAVGLQQSDGWLWSFVKFILGLIALLCLVVAAAILAAMFGWGGWLKTRAGVAGIKPEKAPAHVDPSPAFIEDSGIGAKSGGPVESIDLPGGTLPETSAEGDELEDGETLVAGQGSDAPDENTQADEDKDEDSDSSGSSVAVETLDLPGGTLPESGAEGETLEDGETLVRASEAAPGSGKPKPRPKTARNRSGSAAATKDDAAESSGKPRKRASRKKAEE